MIRCSKFFTLALALALGIQCGSLKAEVVVTVVETSGDVVFSASGTLDLSSLTFDANGGTRASIIPDRSASEPNGSTFTLGETPSVFLANTQYTGITTLGGIFGTNTAGTIASTGTGGRFGIATNVLIVPSGYLSGENIFSTSVFESSDFSTLGLTPGSYVWEWGSDSITMNIIPEPSSALLLGFTVLALAFSRRRNWGNTDN
ncbi:MAG: PEP-CTERM sorting domain-containing protein [Opitutales bacterium]